MVVLQEAVAAVVERACRDGRFRNTPLDICEAARDPVAGMGWSVAVECGGKRLGTICLSDAEAESSDKDALAALLYDRLVSLVSGVY